MPVTTGDPYEVLGISRDASSEEVRKAFRQKAIDNHPDRHPEDPDAHKKMQDINVAHAKIRAEQASRAKYEEQAHKVRQEEQKVRQQQEQWERDQAQQHREREHRTVPVDIARVVEAREYTESYKEAFSVKPQGVPTKAFNDVWNMVGNLFYKKGFGYLSSVSFFKALEKQHKVKPEWTQATLALMERLGLIEFGGDSDNPSDI